MDPKELRGLVEVYNQVYELDENRMASRMEKMPSAPAKVGKATHSIKDLAPSKPPTPEEKAKARKALGLGEAVKGASRHDTEMRKASSAERRAGDKPLSPAKGRDNANKMQRDIKYFDKLTKKNKNVVGLVSNEEVEIFDTVLEFLQVEGYAETLEEAEWLMANVIDEKAIDIILGEEQLDEISNTKVAAVSKARQKNVNRAFDKLDDSRGSSQNLATAISKQQKNQRLSAKRDKRNEAVKEDYMDEAQEARNNPEKYEAGEKKKYAPVRGERTPMPPRGNKRREDFEKWYAANGPK